ncbi:MAG: hypothetical protein QOE22_178 [Candidatus Parcubacteria bacterium]|jgi:hypothetical protein|nr:hypothetical protein [Candidatus Parcubacteria bacterium]
MLGILTVAALALSAQSPPSEAGNPDPEGCGRVTWPLNQRLADDIVALHDAQTFASILIRSGAMVVRNGELVEGDPNAVVVVTADDSAQIQASGNMAEALKRARRNPDAQRRWAEFFCPRTASARPTTVAD